MTRLCPHCGDPLTREATNGTVEHQRGQRVRIPKWFYTCETCGREYHGVRVGHRLLLQPLALAALAGVLDARMSDPDLWWHPGFWTEDEGSGTVWGAEEDECLC